MTDATNALRPNAREARFLPELRLNFRVLVVIIGPSIGLGHAARFRGRLLLIVDDIEVVELRGAVGEAHQFVR
jgi:hypothetical protein